MVEGCMIDIQHFDLHLFIYKYTVIILFESIACLVNGGFDDKKESAI